MMLSSALGLRLESNTADVAPVGGGQEGGRTEQGLACGQDTINFGEAQLTVGHFLAHHSFFQ